MDRHFCLFPISDEVIYNDKFKFGGEILSVFFNSDTLIHFKFQSYSSVPSGSPSPYLSSLYVAELAIDLAAAAVAAADRRVRPSVRPFRAPNPDTSSSSAVHTLNDDAIADDQRCGAKSQNVIGTCVRLIEVFVSAEMANERDCS